MPAEVIESRFVIAAEPLRELAQSILERVGVPPRKAQLVATSLVAANLRGVDSHGVQLLPYYVEQIEWGDLNPHTDGRVVSENAPCMVYDGENGIGQVISEICCQHGVRLAKERGMSMVVARESNHFGVAAFWAQKYSAAGLIGIVMSNASPIVPPWQGKQPRFGTNPICMSVPGGQEKPWLLDMATTTVAANKIYKAATNRIESIPPGWAMDSEGVPTTSTQEALKGLMMPLGGYKGSGLAMLAEILCAVLSGGAMSVELGGIRIRGKAMRVAHLFMGIDIGRFLPLEEFTARMDRLIQMVKSAAPAEGYDEVLIAGEPECRMEETRRWEGIPIEAGTWTALTGIARRLGITAP